MTDFRKKREWGDDEERVCDGSLILLTGKYILPVDESPTQVRNIMDTSDENEMVTFHHHYDPEVEVYARNCEIIAINARWTKVENRE